MVIEVVSQATRETVRACPRCGRSVERGPKARWCSDDCRVRAWQEQEMLRAEIRGCLQGASPAVITDPQAILWAILEQLVKLEACLPADPDVSNAFGHVLLAVDALREMAEARLPASHRQHPRHRGHPGGGPGVTA